MLLSLLHAFSSYQGAVAAAVWGAGRVERDGQYTRKDGRTRSMGSLTNLALKYLMLIQIGLTTVKIPCTMVLIINECGPHKLKMLKNEC